jgi:hypothetical protein
MAGNSIPQLCSCPLKVAVLSPELGRDFIYSADDRF